MTDIGVPMTRRRWLSLWAGSLAGGLAAGLAHPTGALAAKPTPTVTVYKDPACGCCTKWVAHLTASGFSPVVRDRDDMNTLKDSLGVPLTLRACHTAVVGRYLIEGHVPAADLRRLLSKAPRDVMGLAVPDMPKGSPGMDTNGRREHYDVIAFSAKGTSHVFASHA